MLPLLALGAPAAAQETTPREEYEAVTGRPKPAPEIPAALSAMVFETTPDHIFVRGIDGERIPVSIDWFDPREFASHQDGRFFAFSFTGYAAEGYTLVDRRGRGEAAVIETGQAPVFSPDGRWFAAAEMTDSGFGNLNGIALWEVLPDRTVRRFFTDVLPYSVDWRADRWVRPDCVAISSIQPGYEVPGNVPWEEAVRSAPRVHYQLEVGAGVSLSASYGAEPCVPQGTQ